MHFRVVESSFLAWIARLIFGWPRIAMVLGNTIHLSGIDKEVFMSNRKWLLHEIMHIEQFRLYGFWKFLFMYCMESIRHGYFQNRFEIEARAAEEKGIVS